MKAIVVADHTDQALLQWKEVARPICADGDVLVDVYTSSVNRADLLQRAGKYPPPPGAPSYLGLEMAGIVAAVGPNAGDWRVGDRVCALLAGGGYAEQVAVPHQQLLPVPTGWNWHNAGAFPEVFLTAFVNLFMEAGLQSGETVLIHGGASGVGTAAIQLAREANCQIFVTASNDQKLACCRKLGAEICINHNEVDFANAVFQHIEGVDVILDIAGASYFGRNLRLLKLEGRLICIALLGGERTEIDLGLLMRQRLRVIGSVLRSRTIAQKGEIVRQFRRRFWPAVEDGRLEPVIDRVVPISDAASAHAVLGRNENIGKVVLEIRS